METILDPDEVLASLSEAALICRDLSHSWSRWYVTKTDSGYERGLRCRTCETARIELLDSYGHLVGSRRYLYPEGYRVTGGRMSKEFRAHLRVHEVTKALK